ncbi:hypothetical protein ABIB27_002277 [Arthrobacter sp. UYEF21]
MELPNHRSVRAAGMSAGGGLGRLVVADGGT